ncbi:MAG: PAS domain S-box protein [Acidobacteriota bacterium]
MKPAKLPNFPLLARDDYWAAFEQAALALALFDSDLAILDANGRLCELCGYTRDEICTLNISELLLSEESYLTAELLQSLEGSDPICFEAEVATKDGGKVPVFITARAADTANGRRGIISLGNRRIAEHNRVEESLRVSEERFSKTFHAAPDAIVISRQSDGQILEVNDSWEKLFQYSREEWVGRTSTMLNLLVNPEDRENVLSQLNQQGFIRDFELDIRRKSGEVRHVRLIGESIDIDGVPCLLTFVRDVTENKRAEITLRESQRQLASIIESAMDAIITVDEDQRIVLFNAAAEEIFRCPADASIGESLDLFIPPRFRLAHRNHIRAFGATNVTSRSMRSLGTLYGLRADGEEFPIEASISQVEVDSQKLYTVIIRDITKRVETELERSRMASIVQSSDDAIIGKTLDGTILSWNEGAEKIYGYTTQEAVGRPVSILVSSDRRDELSEILEQIRRGEHVDHFETVRVKKDGQMIDVSLTASPIKDAEDRVIGASTIARDITERRQAEEQLRWQAALLDLATDAILVRDLEDRVLFWSKSAERVYGWSAEEAVGKHVRELHYKEIDRLIPESKRVLLEKGEWSGEVHHVTRKGETIAVLNRWTLLRDQGGNAKSILCINTDITEKKKLEGQFFRAQRMESLGTLAGGIAHDLNNILSPIMMALRLFEMRFRDEDDRRLVSVLQETAERGAGLVRQVLSFARGVEGERTLLQPRHLIKEAVRIVKDTLPKSIEIGYSTADDLWPVVGDATQIHQVLMNLIINARDAMPQGGRVRIEASNVWIDENYARMNIESRPGRYILIAVSDTGAGIPASIIDRIFEPFFTTKEQGKGTGLGLSTVLTIVKSHGGFINVYSEEGKGTEFNVYLRADESQAAREAEEAGPELPIGHGELVLVVDDEAAVREITKSTLEAYGYRVVTAGDGTEAVALCAQHKDEIKVLLTDVMMPFMDGPATIRAVRKLNPRIKVIVSSGLKANGKAVEAASLGVKVFLSKPYTADKLLMALADILSTE